MVLPDLWGFSNGISLTQNASNLRNDPKYSLALTTSSVRRFLQHYVLVIIPSVNAD